MSHRNAAVLCLLLLTMEISTAAAQSEQKSPAAPWDVTKARGKTRKLNSTPVKGLGCPSASLPMENILSSIYSPTFIAFLPRAETRNA